MNKQLAVLFCCLALAITACSGESQSGISGTGSDLQSEIDRLAKENEQLKKLQELKQENNALKGNSSSQQLSNAKKATSIVKQTPLKSLPAASSEASEFRLVTCTSKAWNCTAGVCVGDKPQQPECTLIDFNCTNPADVRPKLSLPKCVQVLPSSAPQETQPKSVSTLPVDQSDTLAILNFIGPTALNLKSIEANLEYYNDGSHAEFLKIYREIYSGISARVEFLRDYADISKTRGLTPEEMKNVTTWQIEINNLIAKGNNMLK